MYPYWCPLEPLRSTVEYGMDIVADVKHALGLHSWYKIRRGQLMKTYITFGKCPQPGNSNEKDPPTRQYHAWFTQDWRIKADSATNHLPEVCIDGWWNPRNQPYAAKGGLPASFAK